MRIMKRTKGFTLIELLVVIAIIALLLSVIMPSLQRAKEVARRVVCRNHMKTIGLANEMYAMDQKGHYVPFYNPGASTYQRYWISNPVFRNLINVNSRQDESRSSYITPAEYTCPSDKIAKDPDAASEGTGTVSSYAINVTDWGWSPTDLCGHKQNKITMPSEKLAFIESNDFWADWGSPTTADSGADYRIGWDIYGQDTSQKYHDEGIYGQVLYRHSEGSNVLFYDSHTEFMKKDEIFIIENFEASPKAAGMWVADTKSWLNR